MLSFQLVTYTQMLSAPRLLTTATGASFVLPLASMLPRVRRSHTKYADLRQADRLPNGHPDYVKLILTSRVYDVTDESPITHAVNLSQKTNSNVVLKREDLLPVFSFKLRGAYNMIAQLSPEKRSKGVVGCSAGNHAQGIAFSAKKLGIPATIVMPTATPSIKYQSVARMGARVVLHGADFDAAKKECARIAQEEGLIDIPPFDHPYVIAGQGTIAMELLRQLNIDKVNAIFVPVGGGGLLAGVASYLKRLAPHVRIVGVETFDADALYQSLKAKKRVELSSVGPFADGTAVKILGEETFEILKDTVDEVVRVDTDEICAAIKDVFEDSRTIVEPSGAMSVAGMKRYIANHPEVNHSSATYVPILSGANINFDRLRFVAERAVLGEGKEVFMSIQIPDVPGTFRKLQSIIHPRQVTEFAYRFNNAHDGLANIYTSFSVIDRSKEVAQLMSEFKAAGFEALDISKNEIAKLHGRYLVGGVADLPDERLFSFEFPERPGALTKFLDGIASNWNLTLFHYRNHGHDVGKVLAGISVPSTDEEAFQQFLSNLHYDYKEETDNVVYRKFLRR